MQDCFKLLHFHLGSQIPNIRIVKGALNEAARIYAELVKDGAGLEYLDVGGGLGVDYDGSQTNFESSVNYTLEEYANDVVYHIQTVCDDAGVKHPTIVSESGRAIVAYHSVLVFNVLGVAGFGEDEIPQNGHGDELEQPLVDLKETLPEPDGAQRARELSRRAAGARHGAQPVQRRLPAARAALSGGDALLGHLHEAAQARAAMEDVPEDLQGLDDTLADTYFCNFSLFQSIPDSWAIKQLFPVMPIHRLNEPPTRQAVLGDITCDSDGKIDQFIDRRDVKRTLALHPFTGDAVLPRRVPRRRVSGNPRRPAQPLRRHPRRAREPRSVRQRHARIGDQGRHREGSARLRRVRRRHAAAQAAGRRSRSPCATAAWTSRNPAGCCASTKTACTATPTSKIRVSSKTDIERVVRVVAVAVAGLSIALALWLLSGGGFDLTPRITSHDPRKPALIAALALAVFYAAGGRLRFPRFRWLGLAARIDDRVVVGALAAAVCAVGIVYATTAAGGADSYGYMSQAEGWLSGHVKIPQLWAQQAPWPSRQWSFSPLGWRPGGGDDAWSLVPTYSPGLPLLFAGAKLTAGQEGMFWVVPISGGLLVLATFGLGRRLGDSRAGLIAAALVATSPVVLFMLMAPMTDVPVAAAWTIACYFALGESAGTALAAGFAAAAGILIRPNLVFQAGPIGLWFLLRGWRTGDWGRAIRHAACYGVAASCGIAAVAAINWHLYGSPLMSGYGTFSEYFARANFAANARLYPQWLMFAHTPIAFAGLAALVIPLKRVWPGVKDRAVFVIIALYIGALATQYFFYLVFDVWWYLRFVISALPFILLGVAALATSLMRAAKPALTVAVAIAVVALCARDFRVAESVAAFDLWRGDLRYVMMGKLVRTLTDETSVVYSMQHSGSLRYYAGRLTLNYANLDGDSLDRSVAWVKEQGSHPYLLLESWEIEPFRKQFAGQKTLAVLDTPPVFKYEGGALITFYDLDPPPDRPAKTLEHHGDVHRSSPIDAARAATQDCPGAVDERP